MKTHASGKDLTFSITFDSYADFCKFRDSWDQGGVYTVFESAMTAQQFTRAVVGDLGESVAAAIAAGELKQ